MLRARPPFGLLLSFALASCLVLLTGPGARAHVCWEYSEDQPATRLVECAGVAPVTIIDQHGNWHCAFPSANTTEWGLSFVSFHRQFILDFDNWRLAEGYPRVETWDAAPGEPIPGNLEDYSTGFTHCFDFAGGTDDDTERPEDAPCDDCISLPDDLVGDDNLNDFATLGDVGARLEFSGWHGSFHCGAAEAGADAFPAGCGSDGCNDVGSVFTAPHDPAFWMGHKKLDAIAKDWQRLKAADIVLVLDRSGSMDDNCFDADPDCKIDDAKEAAKLFADLIQDDRPDTDEEHTVGLVSFAGTATKHELGGAGVYLTAASGIVSDNGVDDTTLETELAGVAAGGGTSIGAGIEAALEILEDGTNPHQAIVILSDGEENVAPFIEDIRDGGDLVKDDGTIVQVCAIGFGGTFADPDDVLRSLAEDFGGVFIADPENTESPITLAKFFVECFGQIYDEGAAVDPVLVLPPGQVATTPWATPVCGSDTRATFVLGFDRDVPPCSLRIVVETPAGNLVDPRDPAVESGHGASWNFDRLAFPHNGEGAGTWLAWGVRRQQVYTHGFTTDAYQDSGQGIRLVRREIHRLADPTAPGPLLPRVLYYEDGSLTGRSAYRSALQRELAQGTIGLLVEATSAAQFNALLPQPWDLIVFARQVNPTVQVYDPFLAQKLCAGQRALVTDFYNPVGGNPTLACTGTVRVAPVNWSQIVGDGRLVIGVIPLLNPGYPVYSYTTMPATAGGPWLVQARNNANTGSIVGRGASCDTTRYFVSSLVRGFGRVEAAPTKPRVLVGQKIHAAFRMTESNRPLGDWDMVTARVTLDRPGPGSLESYNLFDDGTNGDQLEGNNYWEREIPTAAQVRGSYALKASFDLTKGGCTIHREAQYAVVVQEEPAYCTRVICPPARNARLGRDVGVLVCARNLCSSEDSLRVTISDSQGWLCRKDSMGVRTPVGPVTIVERAPGDGPGPCFTHLGADLLRICVPETASPGESTIVSYRIHSLGHSSQPDTTCTTVVRVIESLVGVPDSPAPALFAVRVTPNPIKGRAFLNLSLPEAASVRIHVYDVRGRLVARPVDREIPAGLHVLPWSPRAETGGLLPAGVYFYRAWAGDRTSRGTVVIAP